VDSGYVVDLVHYSLRFKVAAWPGLFVLPGLTV
jgi:hypothetical protein